MKKLAVILHVYYENQIPAIRKHLANLNKANIAYDLFVTTPHDSPLPLEGARSLKKTPSPHRSHSVASAAGTPTTGRGYDVAPFLDLLRNINLDDYDYVLKLHTKNNSKTRYTYLNNRRLNNHLWSKIMWNALLGSPQKIKQNLQQLETDPKIGLLAAEYTLTNKPNTYESLLPKINRELQSLGYPPTDTLTFAAGTMFLCRAEVLKPLLKYQITDFPPTDGNIKDGTLAHVIERLFGAVTTAQGYSLAPAEHNTYPISRALSALKRFLYQKKRTKSGKTLIKLCKIPIYHTRPVTK